MRVIGLMSGTSIDGIDAALVRFEGGETDLRWALESFRTVPYTAGQRSRIHDAITAGSAAELCLLHAELGEWHAAAALALCAGADVRPDAVAAIGSHGHTIWHVPPAGGSRGATLQLGCAATIAERTGIAVVSDFRSRDVAAGGHGAPLVPFADRLLYSVAGRSRVLVNIGGMANLTLVPPRGSGDALLAFDTGPGNALIDAAVELATAGRESYDRGGARARSGRVDEALLAELASAPFFSAPPPKSTGRELFGRPWVQRLVTRVAPASDADWLDLVATLTALTARTVADAVRTWVLPRGVDEVIITGGGASNDALVQWIADALAPVPVVEGRSAGIDVDAKEAVAFAALAWAHVKGVPGNVPEATGAGGRRILGSYTPNRK